MSAAGESVPQAADEFPEFSEPPRYRPSAQVPDAAKRKQIPRARRESDGLSVSGHLAPSPVDGPAQDQAQVDALIARLRRERAQGKR